MNKRLTIIILWLSAAGALLLGLGMTYSSASAMRTDADRFKRKLADLQELQDMQREVGSQISAQRSFEKMSNKKPASLSDLVNKAFPESKVTITAQEQKETAPGWIVLRTKVDFGETTAPVAEILALVVKAESMKPPWQLAQCQLWASQRKEGLANTSLTFEALEKK